MHKEHSTWPEYFWQQGAHLGPCEPVDVEATYHGDLSQDFLLYTNECFGTYVEEAAGIWKRVERTYEFNFSWPIRDEVLLGLATRIYRLSIQIVSFPPNWTEDIGQVFARMAAESYIYFKWFMDKGQKEHFEKFYEYGLGQQKLSMEHTRQYLDSVGVSTEDANSMNAGMDFLRRHKMPEFVRVNVGNPLDKNLRLLAEEANLSEVYSLVFSPASSVVHDMYDSLERYYLRSCANPFHCLHRIPYYWYKSPISYWGLSTCLELADWVFADLLEMTQIDVIDALPGKRFMESFYDEHAFEEFMKRGDTQEAAMHVNDFMKARLATLK